MENTKQGYVLKPWHLLLGVLAVIVLFLVISCIGIANTVKGTYNSFNVADENTNAALAEITNMYKRRSGLVPALVATVQGEANFEKSTLTGVIEARAKANSIQLSPEALKDPEAMKQFSQRQGDFTNALSKLMMLTENYPNLKANQAFRDLHAQLEGTENRIAVARNRYIESVRKQNLIIRVFPGNIVAGFFQLQPRPQLTFGNDADLQNAPVVQFK